MSTLSKCVNAHIHKGKYPISPLATINIFRTCLKKWWFTTRKSGINAVNLKDLLGFGSYATAWMWLQKLRRCTIRQEREKLSGRVEAIDITEAFIDGTFVPAKKGAFCGRTKRGKGAKIMAIV